MTGFILLLLALSMFTIYSDGIVQMFPAISKRIKKSRERREKKRELERIARKERELAREKALMEEKRSQTIEGKIEILLEKNQEKINYNKSLLEELTKKTTTLFKRFYKQFTHKQANGRVPIWRGEMDIDDVIISSTFGNEEALELQNYYGLGSDMIMSRMSKYLRGKDRNKKGDALYFEGEVIEGMDSDTKETVKQLTNSAFQIIEVTLARMDYYQVARQKLSKYLEIIQNRKKVGEFVEAFSDLQAKNMMAQTEYELFKNEVEFHEEVIMEFARLSEAVGEVNTIQQAIALEKNLESLKTAKDEVDKSLLEVLDNVRKEIENPTDIEFNSDNSMGFNINESEEISINSDILSE